MATSVKKCASVRAPAKVNLSLRVVRKRPDGYHDLDTLMFAISLYDEVELAVSRSPRPAVTCAVAGPERVEGGTDNLAARAALAVLEALGASARVTIRLRKNVPFGAGLGGGSSDAAAVVRTLPALLGRRLPRSEALAIARRLGADVPFFLDGRPARATGIGDVLTPLERPPRGALVLVVPAERVNTAWAYSHALPRLTSRRAVSRVRALPRSIDAVEAWFFNDFQPGVEAATPSVKRVREALEDLGARAAVLTGSGSAVVGLFPSVTLARVAAGEWKGPDKVFVATMLRRCPRADRRP